MRFMQSTSLYLSVANATRDDGFFDKTPINYRAGRSVVCVQISARQHCLAERVYRSSVPLTVRL
jgi:hypothetical protein